MFGGNVWRECPMTDPILKPLSNNHLSDPDPVRWLLAADRCEELGDAAGAQRWLLPSAGVVRARRDAAAPSPGAPPAPGCPHDGAVGHWRSTSRELYSSSSTATGQASASQRKAP